MNDITLSSLDRKLLAALADNARASAAELARRLKVSRTTIHARLQRLEEIGVILGYGVKLSDAWHAKSVRAHILVTCMPRHAARVEALLKTIDEVRTVHSVSGIYDMIVIVAAPSVHDLDQLIDKIGAIEGVERTTSSIILSTKVDR